MKTLYDYLISIYSGVYLSPLYIKPKTMYEEARLTTTGCMLNISVDMLYGGKY